MGGSDGHTDVDIRAAARLGNCELLQQEPLPELFSNSRRKTVNCVTQVSPLELTKMAASSVWWPPLPGGFILRLRRCAVERRGDVTDD